MAGPRHFLAYVAADRIASWRRRALREKLDAADPRPVLEPPVYAFNDRVRAEGLEPGDRFWVVTQLHASDIGLEGPVLAPSLVARIVVERADDDVPDDLASSWTHCIHPAEGSRFFAGNDALPALGRVSLAPKRRPERPLIEGPSESHTPEHWYRQIARGRERSVPISASSGAELEAFAAHLDRRSLFVSYKHQDFQAEADPPGAHALSEPVDLARALMGRGWGVCLDRLMLPASLSRQRIVKDAELMCAQLEVGLRRSAAVVGIWTRHYGRPAPDARENWTLLEWQARRDRLGWLRKDGSVGMAHAWGLDLDATVRGQQPDDAARSLTGILRRRGYVVPPRWSRLP